MQKNELPGALLDILKSTELFAHAPDDVLDSISDRMETVRLSAGEILFKKGNLSVALYLVVDGELSVLSDEIEIVTLGSGECVGELSLLDNTPRSSTVIAKTDATLLRLARDDFQQMLATSWDVTNSVFQILVQKLRHDTERQIAIVREQERIKQEELRKAMEGTIQAVALVTETRDPYTAGHQQRVAKLACAIAREMGISEEKIDLIRLAGTIHDIGKIFVPSEILSKPGQLISEEFNLLKIHPKIGYDMLTSIDFSWPIAKIVYQHHERMDGSGYPLSLSGDEILMEARFLAVADVVEAMSSHRPYRASLGIDKALEEILQKSGIFYDAEVVDVCLKLFYESSFRL